MHLAGETVVPHVRLVRETLADLGMHIGRDRLPDALVVLNAATDPVRVRIHEDKYYTGELTRSTPSSRSTISPRCSDRGAELR